MLVCKVKGHFRVSNAALLRSGSVGRVLRFKSCNSSLILFCFLHRVASCWIFGLFLRKKRPQPIRASEDPGMPPTANNYSKSFQRGLLMSCLLYSINCLLKAQYIYKHKTCTNKLAALRSLQSCSLCGIQALPESAEARSIYGPTEWGGGITSRYVGWLVGSKS